MHRIDYDGYTIEGGNRRFIDQNEPSTPGTILGAEWMNAVQEEICNVLTYAGETPSASAAADRAFGWAGLRNAIFLSRAIGPFALTTNAVLTDKIINGAVTDDKLASGLGMDKFSHGTLTRTDTSGSVTTTDIFATGTHTRTKADSSIARTSEIFESLDSGSYRQWTDRSTLYGTGGYYRGVRVSAEGIQYIDNATWAGGPYTISPAFKQARISVGKAVGWEFDGAVYTKTITTTIPKTRTIYGIQPIEEDTHGGGYDGNHFLLNTNVTQVRFYRVAESAYWKVTVHSLQNVPLSDTIADIHLLLTYAGA